MKKYKLLKEVSKLLIKGLKVVRPSAGTSFPGKLMMKFNPEYIGIESQRVRDKKICVTGTNGKTTTSGIIASILQETGKYVLHNKKGANMPQGIATSFLQNDDNPIDYCVFECDEAWLYSLYKSLKSDYLLVTNLFPDQTDRYGCVYDLAKKIKKAIDLNSDLRLVLNADDPHLLFLENKNTVYFSVENIENNIKEIKTVSEICPCGSEYKYKKRFYAHIGDFYCPNCINKKKFPKYSAKIILNADETILIINEKYNFSSKLVGLYNAYNVLSAIAIALEIGIDEKIIQKGLNNYQNVFGRIDKFEVNGKKVLLQLIKNPVGTNQAIKLIKDNYDSKLFLLLNDTYADGRDISWLYDTDFEYFKDYPNEIILSGKRAYELALRLKHAGISEQNFHIEHDVKKAYKYAISGLSQKDTLLILANFSTLAELQKIIKR